RFSRDWSSDVCSSDLHRMKLPSSISAPQTFGTGLGDSRAGLDSVCCSCVLTCLPSLEPQATLRYCLGRETRRVTGSALTTSTSRSEERRVGKRRGGGG